MIAEDNRKLTLEHDILLSVFIPGDPAPQGSKRYVGKDRNGRAILAESSVNVKGWRETVTTYIVAAMRARRPRYVGPLALELSFALRRPRSPPAPTHITKPDLSKLLRAVEDSMVDAGLIKDDSHIVIELITKHYPAGPDITATQLNFWIRAPAICGVHITLRTVQENYGGGCRNS
jgi:crossover junction endodeoxyribonuclease RusA